MITVQINPAVMNETPVKTIVGLEALKDEFRRAKLKAGDMRGLKNAFQLSERLGVSTLQTFFYKAGGGNFGGTRAEVYADFCRKGDSSTSWAYSMKDLVEEIRADKANEFEVTFYVATWNRDRTDAERKRISEDFIFKK